MAVYRFDHMHLRSIAMETKNSHLIMIARVAKSPDEIEPASSRSEKRIVSEFITVICHCVAIETHNLTFNSQSMIWTS
jgi:hypothetical protein